MTSINSQQDKHLMTDRNWEDECGDHGGNEGSCGLSAGWGTDFESGKCRFHRGTSPDGSSHKNNGNAETHALRADPKKYHMRQGDEEKEWIFELSEVIQDRIRRVRSDVDPLDRVLARRIAIKLHIAAKASEYVDETGIVQEVYVEDGGYLKEIPNGIVKELRQYDSEIFHELKRLGLVDDPDSQQADALGALSIIAEEGKKR